jgi:hypothetical protein
MYTAEVVERIRQLREIDKSGELTMENMKEAAKLIREGRLSAAQLKSRERSTTGGPKKSPDQLLDELDSM